jgi:hypothetical protein
MCADGIVVSIDQTNVAAGPLWKPNGMTPEEMAGLRLRHASFLPDHVRGGAA